MNIIAERCAPIRAQWSGGKAYVPANDHDAAPGNSLIHQELFTVSHSVSGRKRDDGTSLPGSAARIARAWMRRRAKCCKLSPRRHSAGDAHADCLSRAAIVEICRAIAGARQIILMDEPTVVARDDVERLLC